MIVIAYIAFGLVAIGLLSEIFGAIMMSRSFVAWPAKDVPVNLLRAAVQPHIAQAAKEGERLIIRDPALTVRGLSFIFIGFTLQFVGALGSLLAAIATSPACS